MTPMDKLELQMEESENGGAVVTLPEGEAQGNEPSQFRTDDDDDVQAPVENDDRTAIREARREERRLKKQIHREKAKESNHLITALRKQNETMAERLALLEKKTSGAELARVDKAIEDAGVQVEYAKMKMQEAVGSGDGQALTEAQEMWFDAKRKVEALDNIKKQATHQMSQPKQNHIMPPDPMVQKMASDWMEENPWYDPHGKNEESEIAQIIDKKLTAEGYDPTTEEYWEELSDRVQKYIPNIQNRVYNENNRKSRPRSVVTSSGRESMGNAKANEFYVSPERVNAIKEAGKWDNMQERMKMINIYRSYDKQNKVRG
jgi:hypothetical protein